MQGATVIILSDSKAMTSALTRALVCTGARPLALSFGPDTSEKVRAANPQLVLVDVDEDPRRFEPILSGLLERQPHPHVLMLARDLGPSVAEHVLDHQLNHLLAKRAVVNFAGDQVEEAELIVTCRKLLTGDIFGLEQYLTLPGLDIRDFVVRHSAQRFEAVDRFDEFLKALELRQTMRSVMMTVADELLTNAIFSAPRDEQGKPKYDHLHRKEQFELTPRETVEFSFGCDGRKVVLAVADKFGTLAREIIFRYLGSGLAREKGQMEVKPGGAGLGLHLVFNSITQLVFNIEAGHRTEVIATFQVQHGFRGLRTSGQSLNVFLKP
jgi:hypothetical protein